MSPHFRDACLRCRPIGVIEAEQGDNKDTERNDRIVAVEQGAHSWANIRTIDDLGKHFCRELEKFFGSYHKLSKEKYRVLLKPKSFAGLFGAAPAVALATLGLTVATEGPSYAATEARSTMAGAVALFFYASLVSWIMMRYKMKALGSNKMA